jgi:lysophospholipase L1-like esterase
VRVSGVCGEVTGEMVLRFRPDVLAHHPRYVVVLGGTNDLGWNAHPREIMRNLLKMYETSLAEQVTPILVTVPSLRVETEGSPDGRAWVLDHLDRREELNGMIRRYAKDKHLACVDLFAATAETGSRQLAPQYSNDGLHLTTLGYRRFAELLFDEVLAAAFPEAPGRRV